MDNCCCPKCGHLNPTQSNLWEDEMPVVCSKCSTIYFSKIIEQEWSLSGPGAPILLDKAPIYEIGADAVIINEEHPKYMQRVKIVGFDHINYQIVFKNGIKSWVPEQWIRQV